MPRIAPRRALIAAAASATVFAATSASAADYDMDCKVILCLAGGFPAGCADAQAYMMERITRVPPLPPFGFCGMSNGAQYTNYDESHAFLSRESREGYACRGGRQLHFRRETGRGGGAVTAFCYDHAITRARLSRDGEETFTTYEGQGAAERMDFRIQITVEPGTEAEYRSPTYRINFDDGYTLAE